ncbi:hypothetical protein [Magnetospirillum sp. UT-4]|uniref:hypothetical protein n=1 Tax=Magnetospirillum sp. UT-4 TaxID=2681467 RepID=UPI00137D0A81|nr:hypothetical protein [Magnetospirillum sp. UT-4]CAA7616352.1 conserved hypothetical protein [Magnetospirillum sp. UT-4]
MPAPDPHAPQTREPETREVVATFADREHFQQAVDQLLKAGFTRSDLSVLSSHDSLDAAGREGRSWKDSLVALVGEVKYEGPLVAAGLIALAAGPVGAALAGLVAAGVGGVAIKELLDELAAIPDSESFARALAAGSVILWVLAEDQLKEDKARAVLEAAGGANIHVFERKPA